MCVCVWHREGEREKSVSSFHNNSLWTTMKTMFLWWFRFQKWGSKIFYFINGRQPPPTNVNDSFPKVTVILLLKFQGFRKRIKLKYSWRHSRAVRPLYFGLLPFGIYDHLTGSIRDDLFTMNIWLAKQITLNKQDCWWRKWKYFRESMWNKKKKHAFPSRKYLLWAHSNINN